MCKEFPFSTVLIMINPKKCVKFSAGIPKSAQALTRQAKLVLTLKSL